MAVRVKYRDSFVAFVNSHLAAHTNRYERRNQDFHEVSRRLAFSDTVAYTRRPSVVSEPTSPTASVATEGIEGAAGDATLLWGEIASQPENLFDCE